MKFLRKSSIIYANDELKSALARDLGDCRDNKGKLAKSVFTCLGRLCYFWGDFYEPDKYGYDAGIFEEADPVFQYSADAFEFAAGSVQHVGYCGDRAVCGGDVSGGGWFYDDVDLDVYGISDRTFRWDQCADGALYRGEEPEVGFGDGTFGVSCQPGGRIDSADFGSFYIARCAGAFKYEGGADRQGRSVHPDLFPGDSGACAL